MLKLAPKRTHSGFSLTEVVVAIAIVAIMTSILAVWSGGFVNRPVVAQITSNLATVATAVRNFRDDIGFYPSSLSQLIVQPAATGVNSCNVAFSSTPVLGWRGPYLPGDLVNNAIVMESDTILGTFTRSPATAASRSEPGLLRITVANTTQANAMQVDSVLDGDASVSTGSIQWGLVSTKPRLFYDLLISGC